MSGDITDHNANADYLGHRCNISECMYCCNSGLTINNRAACFCATSMCYHSKLYKSIGDRGQDLHCRKDSKQQEMAENLEEGPRKSEDISSSSCESSSSTSSSSSSSSTEDEDKEKDNK